MFLFPVEMHAAFLTKHPHLPVPLLLFSFSSSSSNGAHLHYGKHTWKLTVAQAFSDVRLKTKYNTPKLYTYYVQAFCEHLVFAKLRKASESATLWRNEDDTDLPLPPPPDVVPNKGSS